MGLTEQIWRSGSTNSQGGLVNTRWLVLIIGGLLSNALADEINDQGGSAEQRLADEINDHGGCCTTKSADEINDQGCLPYTVWLTKNDHGGLAKKSRQPTWVKEAPMISHLFRKCCCKHGLLDHAYRQAAYC